MDSENVVNLLRICWEIALKRRLCIYVPSWNRLYFKVYSNIKQEIHQICSSDNVKFPSYWKERRRFNCQTGSNEMHWTSVMENLIVMFKNAITGRSLWMQTAIDSQTDDPTLWNCKNVPYQPTEMHFRDSY